jgi:outer membrane protein assembly factor BamB
MTNAKKTIANAISLFLILAIAISVFALPFTNAQAPLTMNLPGSEGQPHFVLLGQTNYDIDLNGGPGADQPVELWCWYPGRADSTYIDTYTTRSNGDLDVYDFDFNETGDFRLYWAYAGNTSISNVEIARVVLELPPSPTRQLLKDRYDDMIPTHVYHVISPNPAGVGQLVTAVLFNPQVPWQASYNNPIGLGAYQYHMDLTDPDGITQRLPSGTETLKGDSTGATYAVFTPTKVGNWTVTTTFHEMYYEWDDTEAMRDYTGVTYLESTYTSTLVVQQEPVDRGFPAWPLPTEYWTRPIEGQNTQWWQVASNWLSGAKDEDFGGSQNQYQPDGTAPNSAHIIWTRQTEDGGLVGGGNFSVPGDVFNAGHQYQTRMTRPIIMWGRLYYELPVMWSGGGGGWTCVDLRTGEEIWTLPYGVSGSGMSDLAFGYYYDLDDRNNHGIITPGWLFTSSNFGSSVHPRYGTYEQIEVDDVPGGITIVGPKGEHYKVNFDNKGSFGNPDYYLEQWNSSKTFTSSNGGTYEVNEGEFDWSVPAPYRNDWESTSIRAIQYQDILWGTNGTHPVGTSAPTYHYPAEVGIWAVSLKPGDEGRLLYNKNIPTITNPPDGGEIIFTRAWQGVAVFVKLPERYFIGYDMYTGNKLWDTSAYPEDEFNPFGYFSFPSLINVESHSIAYNTYFSGGYTGAVHAYDLQTGELKWRYEAPSNQRIFAYYTLMLGPIADGKLYVGTHEHSADTPLFKGNKIRCLNATTGEEIWTVSGWAHPGTFAVADGTLVYWNNYDHQVYAVAKGPSSTTVSIQNDVTTHGKNVLVKGSVIDVSPGTKQHAQAARFPNGVPAVSDESMGEWMDYVYMQKPRPTDVTGVEVVISVLDPNNNIYEVGRTTADSDGFFKLAFEPEVPGEYTIIASFKGSESYWPSHAETALFVEEAPAATPEPTPMPASVADLYLVPGIAGIIVAIAVVGAIIVLMLRRR